MQESRSSVLIGAALCLFVLVEVNYPLLQPQSQLAIFATLGLVLCFLGTSNPIGRWLDLALACIATVCGSWIVVQTESIFSGLWIAGQSLGDRAGAESRIDFAVGTVGLLIVLEATRRAVGWALPVLALIFVAYASFGSSLPSWMFPHRGYDLERIVSQTYLHSQGVYGTALKVMFSYVFLFVLFGAILEFTGGTKFVIDLARRIFGHTAGGPAKVAVLSSGLMGSLSGSAVANTATTGTFTIPLMRSAGFRPHVAAGIEAAASSGGALVPPVMGAGAYMMLEIIDPPVTYLQIIKAAIIPALLYYFSLTLIAHFSARGRLDSTPPKGPGELPGRPIGGFVFALALSTLVGLLLAGYTVFRSVTGAILVAIGIAAFDPATRLGLAKLIDVAGKAAKNGIALIAAGCSVGIVLGVVTLTGIGSKLPATIIPMAENHLFLALLLIMASSIILGMGLPSAVCYLLLATLIGPALSGLGVPALAAHLFIFYFGLMSMVTPPVALAAYTAASIAGSPILKTALAAFRFSLVGFALPFLFLYRPQLLLLDRTGASAGTFDVTEALLTALMGTFALSIAIAGYWKESVPWVWRAALLVSAVLFFAPISYTTLPSIGLRLTGAVILGAAWFALSREPSREQRLAP